MAAVLPNLHEAALVEFWRRSPWFRGFLSGRKKLLYGTVAVGSLSMTFANRKSVAMVEEYDREYRSYLLSLPGMVRLPGTAGAKFRPTVDSGTPYTFEHLCSSWTRPEVMLFAFVSTAAAHSFGGSEGSDTALA